MKFTDETRRVVTRDLPGGGSESFLATLLSHEELEAVEPPDPADRAALEADARALALPIRQKALDVLGGMACDMLVAGNQAEAQLCVSARDRIRDMGSLPLEHCADAQAMRQAFKVEWAAISDTFNGHPDLKGRFNAALK